LKSGEDSLEKKKRKRGGRKRIYMSPWTSLQSAVAKETIASRQETGRRREKSREPPRKANGGGEKKKKRVVKRSARGLS